ncbi:hypothetical protein Nepgr_013280 [Nepenthes gracilis]|uniref:UBA domain-containing protein n=1 Tax=Nepenthes gracilis TaxID=150966 RepID=A0AAD3SIM0_NEPGR|nr:hypothetical protein Nepgr_013280 [Nepenthes gracilis]
MVGSTTLMTRMTIVGVTEAELIMIQLPTTTVGLWSPKSIRRKMPNVSTRQEMVLFTDNDNREKICQKNKRKHQRQKKRMAQELHERCSCFLLSRKLEALSPQPVGMGLSAEQATVALILNEGRIEESVAWLFEGGEEVHKQTDQNPELAWILEMEDRFQYSKQQIERAIISCEGYLHMAEETSRAPKQDPPSILPSLEETINLQFKTP